MATKSSYSGLIPKTKVVEKAKAVSSTEFLKVVLGLDRRRDPFVVWFRWLASKGHWRLPRLTHLQVKLRSSEAVKLTQTCTRKKIWNNIATVSTFYLFMFGDYNGISNQQH
jgi:hypothetical protein